MMRDDPQLGSLRLQERLRARLHGVQDAHRALVWTLRASKDLFAADTAAIALRRPGRHEAEVTFSLPSDAPWDLEVLSEYLAEAKPEIPPELLLGPVKRRGRNWAVLVLERRQGFDKEQLRALFSLSHTVTDLVRRLDERRMRHVRSKIEQKIADRQEPKDVIYDILHGLRSLTRYDHSASLYTSSSAGGPLRLVAEQIAWTKAKSRRIGQPLDISEAVREELRDGRPRLFHRQGELWTAADGGEGSHLPALLSPTSQQAPPKTTVVYAPIANREGALAVLEISARRAGVLDAYEAALVGEFRALTSLAVQFSVRTESLQERILKSERKHVLANLTRGIAHDINNALGAMLPLVQQMSEEARAGELDTEQLGADLETLERSLQTCRRIFSGMLSIARGSRDGLGHGNLRRSIEGALSVLEDSLRRRGIEVELVLPDELPLIRGNQGDLTQLFLNLCSNARDSMQGGGRLRLIVEPDPERVEVIVEDTGSGIPEHLRERILEPFFSTKQEGHGLGLAICRSILWDIGGDMAFSESESGGTRVVVHLPVLETPAEEAA